MIDFNYISDESRNCDSDTEDEYNVPIPVYQGIDNCLNYNVDFDIEDPKDIVIESSTPPSFEISYPLSHTYFGTLKKNENNKYTRYEIAKAIVYAYHEIYDEEEKSTTLKVESMNERNPDCSLINRAETDGKWGIWGHDITELDLHDVTYNVNKNMIYPSISS